MKRFSRRSIKIKRISSVLLASALFILPAANTMANTYTSDEVSADDTPVILFPGDYVCSLWYPVYVQPDMETPVQLGENDSWTNRPADSLTNRVYSVSETIDEETGEPAYYTMQPEGCILTISGGSSELTDSSAYLADERHYEAQDPSQEPSVQRDLAFYYAGEQVMLTPEPPAEEGKVFGGYTVDSANVNIDVDTETGIGYMIMPDQEVRISVYYVDALPEEQQPAAEEMPEGQAEGGEDMAAPQDEYADPEQQPADEYADPEQQQVDEYADPEQQPVETYEEPEYGEPDLEHLVMDQNAMGDIQQLEGGVQVEDVTDELAAFLNGEVVQIEDADAAAAGGEQAPAEEAPAEEQPAPAEEVPAEAQPAPAEETPAEAQPAPAEEAPEEAQPAPAEEAPAEDQAAPAVGEQDSIFAHVEDNMLDVALSETYSDQVQVSAEDAFVQDADEAEEDTEAVTEEDTEEETQEEDGAASQDAEENNNEENNNAENNNEENNAGEFNAASDMEALAGEMRIADAQAQEEPVVIEVQPAQADEPAQGEPAQGEPGQEQPSQEQPGQEQPGQEQLGQEQPGQEEPGQEQPGQEQPGQEQPAQEQPGQEQPGQEMPGQEEQPGQEQPAQEQPSQEQSAQEQPAQEVDEQANEEQPVKTEEPAKTDEPTKSEDPVVEEEDKDEKPVINTVTVKKGSGGGSYQKGDKVTIKANKPDTGWEFVGWTVSSGDASLNDPFSEKTSFTMPGSAVTVTAEYEMIEYTLEVKGGSGDGEYNMDDEVSISADKPADGKEFNQWVIESGNPDITGMDRFYASLVMPASDVTVTSTYKDGPNPANNTIANIVAGAEYLKGSTITFSAIGAGMDNSNPNPWDYRYKPTGYQIGTVSSGWSDTNYTTSMAINAVGDYTLQVTFTKEIFNGESWVSDGTTDVRAVSFHVVNALSVATGDDTPITLLVGIAAGALLIVAAVCFVLIRRKRK